MFAISGSNHYGIAGYYAMQALKENMIVSDVYSAFLFHTKGHFLSN